jgi:hypothetical protein
VSILYTVSYTGAVTNAGGNADLLELTPGDDAPIRLRRISIGFTTEVGDAAEEQLSLSLIYLPATVTSSNGTAVTPRALDQRMPAAVFAAEANGATVATTSGTALTLGEYNVNVRQREEFYFGDDPTLQPVCRQGAAFVLRNNSTVADDATVTITAEVWED